MDPMPAITARLEEARKAVRHRVFLWATLTLGEQMLTVDCLLRDWSDNGARIELPTPMLLPDEVWLVERHMPIAYQSRVVWRRARFVGVAFVHRHSLDNPADPRLRILRRLWAQHMTRAGTAV